MQQPIYYEYPLNEHIRVCLRLEAVFGQAEYFLTQEGYWATRAAMNSLCDLISLLDRPDFKNTLIENFGLTDDENGKTWLAMRQPLNYVSKLSKNLPILIAQGTQDTRVCLKEGYDMMQALHDAGHEITYIEIEGGDHVLRNTPDFIPVLMDWLERP